MDYTTKAIFESVPFDYYVKLNLDHWRPKREEKVLQNLKHYSMVFDSFQ